MKKQLTGLHAYEHLLHTATIGQKYNMRLPTSLRKRIFHSLAKNCTSILYS